MDVGHHERVASIAGSATVSEQPRGTIRATGAGINGHCNSDVALAPEVNLGAHPRADFGWTPNYGQFRADGRRPNRDSKSNKGYTAIAAQY